VLVERGAGIEPALTLDLPAVVETIFTTPRSGDALRGLQLPLLAYPA